MEMQQLLVWLGVVSALTFVASLVAIPWLINRLPRDYFLDRCPRGGDRHPLWRLIFLIGRNSLGMVLLAGGAAMLVLPGQGILTMIIGLSLIDFPGKHRLVRWLVSHERVRGAMNWIRTRSGRPPLLFDQKRPAQGQNEQKDR